MPVTPSYTLPRDVQRAIGNSNGASTLRVTGVAARPNSQSVATAPMGDSLAHWNPVAPSLDLACRDAAVVRAAVHGAMAVKEVPGRGPIAGLHRVTKQGDSAWSRALGGVANRDKPLFATRIVYGIEPQRAVAVAKQPKARDPYVPAQLAPDQRLAAGYGAGGASPQQAKRNERRLAKAARAAAWRAQQP